MANPKIQPARNNEDRKETYRYMTGRYKLSVKEGFYFEALLIVYAMIEDRMKSLLFYAGVCDNRNTFTVSTKTEGEIRYLLKPPYGSEERLELNSITGKMRILDAILNWSEASISAKDDESKYLVVLKRLFECTDIESLRSTLKEIKRWLNYRNEIIHAALNKNLMELNKEIKAIAESGIEYARALDAHVKIIKKDNRVRKALGMAPR